MKLKDLIDQIKKARERAAEIKARHPKLWEKMETLFSIPEIGVLDRMFPDLEWACDALVAEFGEEAVTAAVEEGWA